MLCPLLECIAPKVWEREGRHATDSSQDLARSHMILKEKEGRLRGHLHLGPIIEDPIGSSGAGGAFESLRTLVCFVFAALLHSGLIAFFCDPCHHRWFTDLLKATHGPRLGSGIVSLSRALEVLTYSFDERCRKRGAMFPYPLDWQTKILIHRCRHSSSSIAQSVLPEHPSPGTPSDRPIGLFQGKKGVKG